MFASMGSPTLSFNLSHLHQEAVIDEIIHPGREWWVKHQGSLWKARSKQSNVQLRVGDTAYVVDRRCTLLLIQPQAPQ